MTAAVAAGFSLPKVMRVPRLKGDVVADVGGAVDAIATDCLIMARCVCSF
jgi:hypothetical protein